MDAKLFMHARGRGGLTNTYRISSEKIQDVAENRMLLLMNENRFSV
jgi:hypothetical protein